MPLIEFRRTGPVSFRRLRAPWIVGAFEIVMWRPSLRKP